MVLFILFPPELFSLPHNLSLRPDVRLMVRARAVSRTAFLPQIITDRLARVTAV